MGTNLFLLIIISKGVSTTNTSTPLSFIAFLKEYFCRGKLVNCTIIVHFTRNHI